MMRNRTHHFIAGAGLRHLALGLLIMGLTAAGRAAPSTNDFAFFLMSDIHIGTDKPKENPPVTPEQVEQRVRRGVTNLVSLLKGPLPERPAFKDVNRAPPADVKGIVICGDLTDGHPDPVKRAAQWTTYNDLFPAQGVVLDGLRLPVFPAVGNHDGELKGPVRQGLIEQNRARLKAGVIDAISENGVHYAVNWNGVHFICMNLYPADGPDAQNPFRFGGGGPGQWNDPQGALTFMTNYLHAVVGKTAPVILMHHYGFDGFSAGDWYWWTAAQRRAYYDAIRDFNVLAIFHGHDHASRHYVWPDPKGSAADTKAMFGDEVPADLRQFTVISCGPLGWLCHVKDGKFMAAHHTGKDWNGNNGRMVVKPLYPEAKP